MKKHILIGAFAGFILSMLSRLILKDFIESYLLSGLLSMVVFFVTFVVVSKLLEK